MMQPRAAHLTVERNTQISKVNGQKVKGHILDNTVHETGQAHDRYKHGCKVDSVKMKMASQSSFMECCESAEQ